MVSSTYGDFDSGISASADAGQKFQQVNRGELHFLF